MTNVYSNPEKFDLDLHVFADGNRLNDVVRDVNVSVQRIARDVLTTKHADVVIEGTLSRGVEIDEVERR